MRAAIAPGTHPAIVSRVTSTTDPQPLSNTASGGRMMQRRTRPQPMTIVSDSPPATRESMLLRIRAFPGNGPALDHFHIIFSGNVKEARRTKRNGLSGGRRCREQGSNLHIFRYRILNPARLPIPPSRRGRVVCGRIIADRSRSGKAGRTIAAFIRRPGRRDAARGWLHRQRQQRRNRCARKARSHESASRDGRDE
jgi:hypothetical protein